MLSLHFRLLHIRGNWQFMSFTDEIALAEEENSATAAASEEGGGSANDQSGDTYGGCGCLPGEIDHVCV